MESDFIGRFQRDRESHLLSLLGLFAANFYIDWLIDITQIRASELLSFLESKVKEGLIIEKGPRGLLFQESQEEGYLLRSAGKI